MFGEGSRSGKSAHDFAQLLVNVVRRCKPGGSRLDGNVNSVDVLFATIHNTTKRHSPTLACGDQPALQPWQVPKGSTPCVGKVAIRIVRHPQIVRSYDAIRIGRQSHKSLALLNKRYIAAECAEASWWSAGVIESMRFWPRRNRHGILNLYVIPSLLEPRSGCATFGPRA